MTATTTTTRPTPARTNGTPTRTASTSTASTSTARTTPGNRRRNTTPPTKTTKTTKTTGTTETTETAVVGAGPAAGSEQRVHAALSAGGDLTVRALVEATGLGRSTVSTALTRLEAAGQAVRTTIGSSGRARQPDRWNPTTTTTTNATAPPSPADTPQAQTIPVPTPQAQPETPVGSGPGNGAAAGAGPRPTPARKGRTRRPSTPDTPTTSSPSDGPTSAPAPTSPPAPSGPVGPDAGAEEWMNPKSGTARLAPGALTQLVADHFGRHPGVPLTSGEVGRALGRSGGAVRNAADKLVGDGALRLLDGAPRRYTTTD